jgi:hypothetical protein
MSRDLQAATATSSVDGGAASWRETLKNWQNLLFLLLRIEPKNCIKVVKRCSVYKKSAKRRGYIQKYKESAERRIFRNTRRAQNIQ